MRVPSAQGRAWYKGLKLMGVPMEMVVYPGQGHILDDRICELDEMRCVLAWYDKHLKEGGSVK